MDCQEFIFTGKKLVRCMCGDSHGVWGEEMQGATNGRHCAVTWGSTGSEGEHLKQQQTLFTSAVQVLFRFATLSSRLMTQNKPGKLAKSTTSAALAGGHDSAAVESHSPAS